MLWVSPSPVPAAGVVNPDFEPEEFIEPGLSAAMYGLGMVYFYIFIFVFIIMFIIWCRNFRKKD